MKRVALQTGALSTCRNIFQRAMAAIGAGQSSQQELQELSGALQALRQTVVQAERLYEIAIAAESASRGKPASPTPAPVPAGRLKKLETKVDRSEAIRSAAAKLAIANGGRVDLKGVEAAVRANGFDLGTKIPGTMIGNVLNKSRDWKRLHKGAYEQVPVQH